jgi:hypothetical protein
MAADPPFQAISAAVSGLVAASETGFTISENGAKPLLDAIEDLAGVVAGAMGQSSVLTSHLPLGGTPNATVYKPFLATIATDPEQGAIPALRKLHGDLTNAHTAIKKAMDNYREVEARNTSAVRNSGMWV